VVIFINGNQAGTHAAIKFSNTGKALCVHAEDDTLILEATLTLNDQRQCRFKLNGQEYESWQIRKRALQKLFFETA